MQITRIKLCRFKSGLLQFELARQANINWRRLSEIESGRSRPETEELARLAAALGVPSERLVDSMPA